MIDHPMYWVFFNLFLLGMLALDLGVFHRKSHTVSVREALIWTGVWISIALGFNVLIYFYSENPAHAGEFLAGYVLEKSLSVDNIFVMVLIFQYFKVPTQYQHKVLFWGILGALIMRAIFIFAGVALIERFQWMIYVFGAFLVFTGIKMAFSGEKDIDPEHNILVRLCRKLFRITPTFVGGNFFTRIDGQLAATPLFLVLVFVEFTDLLFAVDSIPAILAVTRDPFIVYSSNALAILGLRSLYFALGGLMQIFRFLNLGLAIILIFVGVKMLLTSQDIHIPIELSLSIIAGVLIVAVAASLIWKKDELPAGLETEPVEEIKDAIKDQREDQAGVRKT